MGITGEGRSKNCAKRLTLPAPQPDRETQVAAQKDDRAAEDSQPGPTVEQPEDQQRASARPEPAESAQCISRQEWETEQDFMELGRHLLDSLDTFQERSDSFHMFLE